MMHGVWIDEQNTLTEYGLALLADLKIGMPAPRTKYVDVPEADGDLDLTGSLTGGVVRYGMRQISFNLFPVYDIIAGTGSPAPESHAAMVRQKLAEKVHGQRVRLWLPDDADHYFVGRMEVGEKGGYNKTTIPVTMQAEPWRYKNTETEIRITTNGAKVLSNETRQMAPTFTATDSAATVTFGTVSHQLAAGINQFNDIILQPGLNTITISGINNPVIIKYQEAVL